MVYKRILVSNSSWSLLEDNCKTKDRSKGPHAIDFYKDEQEILRKIENGNIELSPSHYYMLSEKAGRVF